LKARTGELTPPGITAQAWSKSCLFLSFIKSSVDQCYEYKNVVARIFWMFWIGLIG
jgi:hypothetical protein